MKKLLIVGGLVLILCGNLFGAVYSSMFLPTVKKEQNETLKNAIEIASESATGALREVDKYVNKTLFGGRSSNFHSHMTLIGVLALTLSSVVQYFNLSEVMLKLAIVLLLVGGAFLPSGIFIEMWSIQLGSGISMFGGMCLLLSITIFLIGAIRMKKVIDSEKEESG
ncbi:hypothetical protein [Alkalihalobacterium elongatum]|uniref:hypothetical protein n=1 Tax=Alkalihalobacterium elongatum TaxID=2675466 RepID=UPI001C1F8626|nr:hypothetical protein [Alkalihalobacterium elongatum]